jgi:hypothetical protein
MTVSGWQRQSHFAPRRVRTQPNDSMKLDWAGSSSLHGDLVDPADAGDFAACQVDVEIAQVRLRLVQRFALGPVIGIVLRGVPKNDTVGAGQFDVSRAGRSVFGFSPSVVQPMKKVTTPANTPKGAQRRETTLNLGPERWNKH